MQEQRTPTLRAMVLALLTAWSTSGYATGLGSVRVLSALGQPLRASVTMIGDDIGDHCVKARLESLEGYRVSSVQARTKRMGQGGEILFTTATIINEPSVTLQVNISCGTQLNRSYQLLLDPAVILPQTAGSERPLAADSSRKSGKQRRNVMEAVVPPMALSDTGERSAHKKSTKKASAEASAIRMETSLAQPVRTAEADDKKFVRNVLKLSSDEDAQVGATFSPVLKLAGELSESRDTGDAKQMEELRAAQQQFAAIARGETPAQVTDTQYKAAQAKVKELEEQTQRAQQESQERQVEMETMRKEMVPGRWITWLLLLIVSALGAIAWLFLRLREERRAHEEAIWLSGDTVRDTSEWPATSATKSVQTEMEQDTEQHVAAREDEPEPDAITQHKTLRGKSLSAVPATPEHVEAPVAPEAVVPQPEAGSPLASRLMQEAAIQSQPVVDKQNDAYQMQVEEISDLMQEAEFWMMLNDVPRAIDILEPYADVEQPVSPVPWIYLLDLYHAAGAQDKYELLKNRIQQHFNASVPAWGETAAEHHLEEYPHVVETIRKLWESDDIVPYLEHLMEDNRDGDRVGFDLSVYREIIHLISVAREPNIARRRDKLQFDKVQPRQVSQQVKIETPVEKPTAKPVAPVPAPVMSAPIPQPKPADIQPVAAPTASPAETVVVATPDTALKNEEAREEATASDVATQTDSAEADDALTVDMATKLDLAMAYQEIGEHVGARVLLEEVIQLGTPIQIEKAKAMLKKLLKEIDWL